MVIEFDRRRRVIIDRLNTIPGVSCRLPGGAFYAFPNIGGILGRQGPTGPIQSPQDVAQYLLKEARVAVVPGEAFGSRTHIRLSYATGMEAIERGIQRIAEAFHKLSR